MRNALLIDQGTGEDGHTGGFWLVCRYHIRGKLATASYSLHPPLFLFPIFLFLDFFFWRGGGYLIHMLGLPARFLSLGLGGLVGCGVGEGWFCMLKALLSKVCRSKK